MNVKIFHNPKAPTHPWRAEFYNEHGNNTRIVYFTEEEWRALRACPRYTENPEPATDDPI